MENAPTLHPSTASLGSQKGVHMDFSTTTPGTLDAGTVTTLGTIERTSFTAYRINGAWVPFAKVHGAPKAAEEIAAPWVARY